MSAQAQRFEDLPLVEKGKILQAAALFPALTLIVFIRRKIGFRTLRPNWLLLMTAILLTIAEVAGDAGGPFKFLLPLYALAVISVGHYRRHLEWVALCKGTRWHTYSSGISYLEFFNIPVYFQTHRRVYRFLDPLACFLVGLLVGFLLSRALGAWIVFSSIALFLYEQSVYETILERDLDTLDGLIASEVQAEVVKHYQQPQAEEARQALEETAGIPTGVAPDIHKQVELRRAKRTPPPDNLVAEVSASNPAPLPAPDKPTPPKKSPDNLA